MQSAGIPIAFPITFLSSSTVVSPPESSCKIAKSYSKIISIQIIFQIIRHLNLRGAFRATKSKRPHHH